MLKFEQILIFYIVTLITLILLYYLLSVSLIFIILLTLIFLGIIIFAVFNIRSNIFVKAFSSSTLGKKVVAITFDDGPSAENTNNVLDILKEYNVKATFFCIGEKIIGNEKIIHRIADDGHLIGNHSFSHKWEFGFYSTKKIISEIETTNKLISNLTGRVPVYFRPPYGVTNPMIAKAVDKLDMKVISWNVRSYDTVKSIEKSFERIMRKLKPGSIILLHDRLPGAGKLLKKLLEYIEAEGYKVIELENLLGFKK